MGCSLGGAAAGAANPQGGLGSYLALDPAQQLAQLKLLRERAVAARQLRVRVARARRRLVTAAQMAAVLAGRWTLYSSRNAADSSGKKSNLESGCWRGMVLRRLAVHAQRWLIRCGASQH